MSSPLWGLSILICLLLQWFIIQPESDKKKLKRLLQEFNEV
jgi:hypothetical protein